MRSVMTFGLGLLIGAAAPGLRAQMNPLPPSAGDSVAEQAGQTAQQASKPPAKPAAQAGAKPATQTPAKPAAQAPAKPAPTAPQPAAKPTAAAPAKQPVKASKKPEQSKAAAKSAGKAVEKPAGPESAPKAAAESELKAARRDPFESLVSHGTAKAAPNLPPGKAGLQVSTLRLDGIVRAPNGMIAVVSNPQSRTYFLREGDHLYDGSVDKITMDGVSFHEEGKDAFGKPLERQVNKRIYSTSSGEQQ